MENNLIDEKVTLQKQQDVLALSKIEHEVKLSKIKNMVRGSRSIAPEKYRSIIQSQNNHNRCLLKINRDLHVIKGRLRELYSIEQKENNQPGVIIKPIVEELVRLRAEYQEFAADRTRVGSMRQMAAEFVLKLNPIIKQSVL